MNKHILSFWNSLSQNNVKLGLEKTKALLQRLGNPQDDLNIVHIAGTNGKGSTLATLERLLIDSGYTVCSTVSPHLVSINERFRHQTRHIDDKELAKLFYPLFQACGINDKNMDNKDKWLFKPTYFETQIVLFLLWSKWKKSDFTLLETGLGGRLDATNVVKPICSAITAISYDHQNFLGNTLSEIAKEKLAIIKKDVPCIIANQPLEVRKLINSFKSPAPLYNYGIDFGYYNHNQQSQSTKYARFYSMKSQGSYFNRDIAQISLLGDYQWENTATALAIYHHISDEEKLLDNKSCQESLKNVKWSGRLEYWSKNPQILLDTAHNQQGMLELFKYLNSKHKQDKIHMAVCWMKDKDIRILHEPELNITYQPLIFDNPRAKSIEEVYASLKASGLNVLKPIKLQQYIKSLLSHQINGYSLFVLGGSIYLIGDFIKYCNRLKLSSAA